MKRSTVIEYPKDGAELTAGLREHTGFTVLWTVDADVSLQSLLDTTPPKLVPVLWDGPAPAPSEGIRYSSQPFKIADERPEQQCKAA